MGRSESAPRPDERTPELRAKAISGTNVVLLAWDLPLAESRRGLLGFALRKTVGGCSWWLPSGGRRFASDASLPSSQGPPSGAGPEGNGDVGSFAGSESGLAPLDGIGEPETAGLPRAGPEPGGDGQAPWLTTREAPIQAFSWCDYTCRPGDACRYLVCPVYTGAGAGPLRVEEAAGAELEVRLEANGPAERHEVWFNHGVAGSQAYSRRFGAAALEEPEAGGEARAWLSRGLGEALLAFIARAEGPGWSLRGAFYEFTWRPALEALVQAASRGAHVSVVVDCGPSAPREPAPAPPTPTAPAVARGDSGDHGRVDLRVPFAQKDEAKRLGARWDPAEKVWYAPAGEPQLLAKWGRASGDAAKAGPLKADLAIDAVLGARALVLRRERGKGIQHNKFLVLVPPEGEGMAASVWTGGLNMTDSGVHGQSNVAHVVNGDARLAQEYLAYWEQLARDRPTDELAAWNAARLADEALPPVPDRGGDGAHAGPGVCAVMSPRPSAKLLARYGELLESAQSCSCLTAAFGVERGLANILAKDVGVSRYVLLEKPGATFDAFASAPANHVACGALLGEVERRDGLDEEAQASWAQERLTGLNEHVQFVHNKLMLVDPLGSWPTVVSGSANFSQASVLRNDENMLFISGDTRVADMYFVEFWRLFQHWRFRDRVAHVASERRAARQAGVEGPSPLSLRLAEDDSWAAPYYESGNARCRERELLMALHMPAAGGGSAATAGAGAV